MHSESNDRHDCEKVVVLVLQSWRLPSSLPVPVGPAREVWPMRVPDEAADKDFGCLLAQDWNPLTRIPVAQDP